MVALLASVEGGEIVKALLERDVDVSTTAEEFAVEGNANGLRARDVKIGGGASAKRGDFVGVNLTVVDAEDGVEYLNTKKAKRPIAFTYEKKPLLAPICEAIEDGVRTMKRGGVRRVFAPSAAASVASMISQSPSKAKQLAAETPVLSSVVGAFAGVQGAARKMQGFIKPIGGFNGDASADPASYMARSV